MALTEKVKKRSSLMEVMVPAVTSIVVALITTYGVIAVGSNKLEQARESATSVTAETQKLTSRAEALGRTLAVSPVPVGSILSSSLSPDEFAQAAGDPAIFDPTKSKWAFADGRQVVGSTYHELTNGKRLLDLRGLFLRGVNAGRSDKWKDPEDREAGQLQPDQFQTHGHEHPRSAESEKWYKGGDDLRSYTKIDFGPVEPKALPQGDEVRHGSETRPANIAVFYYIKIN